MPSYPKDTASCVPHVTGGCDDNLLSVSAENKRNSQTHFDDMLSIPLIFRNVTYNMHK
jgi:hypothetical protein